MTERPTIAIDAQTAATLVHLFDGGLAEHIGGHMTCEEVNALAALLPELGAAQRDADYWVDAHKDEGDCDGSAHVCPVCGSAAGVECAPACEAPALPCHACGTAPGQACEAPCNGRPCPGCGAEAGEDCTPLSMCGADRS